jgi:hypothetical protein
VAITLVFSATPRNTPDNLVHWIVDPRGLNPKTRMPGTGIPEPAARDIAAYLYLRRHGCSACFTQNAETQALYVGISTFSTGLCAAAA